MTPAPAALVKNTNTAVVDEKGGIIFMEAGLSITTCDKCREPMEKGQKILVIAEGLVKSSNDELDFTGSGVRYACHLKCWDRVEEATS